jgi:hypothetical protein
MIVYLRLTLTRTVIDDDPHPHRYEAGTTSSTPPMIEHSPTAALPPRRWSKLAGLLRGIATKLDS